MTYSDDRYNSYRGGETRYGRYGDDRGYGDMDGHDEPVFGQQDVRFAEDAFKKSANAMGQAKLGETTKVFGFKVDAGLAAYLASIYNVGSDYATRFLAPKTEKLTRKLGSQAGLQGKSLDHTTALTTFGVAVALKAGKDISTILGSFTDQRKERAKLAHALAPVLDDIKGKHSVGTLYSVSEADNEVIYAHRQRMAKIAHTENTSNVISIAMNAGPNLLMDTKILKGMWNGSTQKQVELDLKAKQLERDTGDDNGEMKHLGRTLLNTTTGQVADRVRKSNEYKLRTTLQPYSALEMILELDKQVASDPKASSFGAPKSFQNQSRRTDSYPLEEYVCRIMIQHQKDMSDISPDHTEIRDALKGELSAAVKPIAKALRNGDMSALSLVRLVGEGKIVKNRGRAIAGVKDVEALVAKETPKQASYVQVDPKDYYKDASFTRDELKTALKGLQGEERTVFASMMPDAVLEEAGMAKAEIKKIREHVGRDYERQLAEIITGLHEQSPEELQKHGLASKEIHDLNEAYEQIEQKGLGAIRDMKASPANEQGIERLLSNWAVSSIQSDKTYFGTVLSNGRQKQEAPGDDTQAKKDNGKFPKSLVKHHYERGEPGDRDAHGADEGRHARRERSRSHKAETEQYYRD